ncbi:MAG: hypothetical protein UR96_C0017G0007 [candidate division WS6 bacterium GW2011_GWC1_36_11]|uniref:Uncharacterized protein n=1 Tax=candidate division WS6 bacterium GW2011_GWC1_36_11 TaxID=1619090 RepID=A0A0G0FY95_9BACT|nr:MAG: hypothetical protein UR96_C0017G0007 [candidate division WS6 bacterium GW2011_GWC1_36_11]
MSSQVSQELQPSSAYRSGYTFFPSLNLQNEIANFNPSELSYTLMYSPNPNIKTQYIHELWRTGRMELVYRFFKLPEEVGSIGDKRNPSGNQLTEQDIVNNCQLMMSTGKVPEEECIAFVKDLCFASANVHDNQNYGEEPQDLTAVVERTMKIMEEVRCTSASSI